MNAIKNIVEWQKERLLDKQEFDSVNEATNIIEEIYEMFGVKIPKESREDFKEWIRSILPLDEKENKGIYGDEFEEPSSYDKVDALFDICVFAIGGMLKLGFDPECIFNEGIKEISSRTGKIIDGKFQKDTSPEAKAKWYKADYSKCKKS